MHQVKTLLIAILLSATGIVLLSCSNGGGGASETGFPEITVKEPTAEALQSGAMLKGIVEFEGNGRRSKMSMAADRVCSASHEEPPLTEGIVATDGRLRDVMVYISKGLEDYRFPWVTEAATIDQVGCVYKPHVLAVRTRQPVKFLNSDATSHNVNSAEGTKLGQGFNKTTPTKGSSFEWQFRKAELGIRVKCDIHPWMSATIHVLDHPYFSVTDEQGQWEFARALPPGRYTLTAVHPGLGDQSEEIEIKAGEAPTLPTFKFKR